MCERKRQSGLVEKANKQRSKLNTGLNFHVLFIPQGAHSHCTQQTPAPFPQMLCLAFKDTLQRHPTCFPAPQGGNIVHQLYTLTTSRSFFPLFFLVICGIVCLSLTPLPNSLCNVINTFHPCQSKT